MEIVIINNRKKLVVISLLFLIFMAFHVYGSSIYYVDASGGNDNNDGLSISSVWRTINKVNNYNFLPGDRILFKRGNQWRELLYISCSGSASSPIIFGAYGTGPNPIIKGTEIFSGWSEVEPNVWVKNGINVQPNIVLFDGVCGIIKYGDNPSCLQSDKEWFWHSNSLYQYSVSDPDIRYTNPGTEMGIRDKCIVLEHVSHVKIQDIVVEGANEYGVFLYGNLSNVILDGITAQKNGYHGITSSSEYEQDDVIVQNCTASFNGAYGIVAGNKTKRWTISKCNAHHNGTLLGSAPLDFGGGIKIGGAIGTSHPENCLVENCKVTLNGINALGNPVANNKGFGIWLDINQNSEFSNHIIRYNEVYENNDSGIVIEKSKYAEVYYNLSYKNADYGIWISADAEGPCTNNNKIYNNCVYANKIGICAHGPYSGGYNLFSNNEIKNNIVSGNSYCEFSAKWGGENSGAGLGNLYSFNCFGAESQNFIEWGSGVFLSSYDTWESYYGSETTSVNAEPNFTNPTSAQFTPHSSSPCINAGTDVGLKQDFIGNDVPNGRTVDIGAYEYVIEDLLGSWPDDGVYYKDSRTSVWYRISPPASTIAAGDLDGYQLDDLLGVWSDGVWMRSSELRTWTKLCAAIPSDIASGDMDGDARDDLVGSWISGVYYRDSIERLWIRMAPSVPNQRVAVGDLDGDGSADLIGVWNDGVWIKYSSTYSWSRVSPVAHDIAAGDMNGDGRDDLVGSWDGQGVFYKDSKSKTWHLLSSVVAKLVATGDLDADATDDLLVVFNDGLWVKYSKTKSWKRITSILPKDIDTGIFGIGILNSNLAELNEFSHAIGEDIKGPGQFQAYEDLSDTGPLGWKFVFKEQPNMNPIDKHSNTSGRIPGPGEPGFIYIEQENLVPRDIVFKKKDKKR